MLYNFSFDIAALIVASMLIMVSYLRGTYSGVKVYAFRAMLMLHFFAIVFDLISVYTISFPQNYSLALCNFINIGYYLTHNLCGIAYVIYGIYSESKYLNIKKALNPWIGAAIIETFIIVTSPITKFVMYFDENLKYQHGFGMYLLYAIAMTGVVYVMILKIRNREHRSNFEVISNITYAVILLASFICVVIKPFYLVELFAVSVGFCIMHFAQGGPELYFYKGNNFFNRYAFDERLLERCGIEKDFATLIFTPKSAETIKATGNLDIIFAIEKYMYSEYNKKYGKKHSFFMIDDMCAALFCRNEELDSITDGLIELFANPKTIDDKTYNLDMAMVVVKYPEIAKNYEEAAAIIDDVVNDKIKNHKGDYVLVADRRGIRKNENRMIQLIRNAIDKDGIDIKLQPVFSRKDNHSFVAESIIKIRDEKGRLIDYEEFMPVAERNGLVFEIDEIILVKVCEYIEKTKMLDRGISAISMNISSAHLLEVDFCDHFENFILKHNIPSEKISFLFSDIKAINDNPQLLDTIQGIKKLGFGFSLDFFGKSYLNLELMYSMPINAIKLDTSIVDIALKDKRGKDLLLNTLKIIKDLGIKTICGGVDSVEHKELLNEIECDYEQGDYLSKPLEEEEYLEFLRSQFNEIMNDIHHVN